MSFQGFGLPDKLRMLADTVGEFVRQEIWPVEARIPGYERGLPAEEIATLQKKARTAGFWCLEAPEPFGGGLSVFQSVVVTEQMVKHRYSLPRPGAGTFGLEPPLALYHGTPEQIQRYVLPTIEHGWSAFIAVSEPTGGSDPARAIRTTATREGTNGPERAMSVARQLRCGTVGHNSQRTDFAIGFGGMKQAGVGREGGREGILPFLEPKTVVLDAEVPI
jgi:acyl-CoA dehydrogenase